MTLNLLTLSHPTYVGPSGATAAATYQFMTKRYQPPAETRHLDMDIVHNQNGKFKYIYDNGPGFRRWPSFQVTCQDVFEEFLSLNAAQQYENLKKLWAYPGVLGLHLAGESYNVHWSQETLEPSFIKFPVATGATIERDINLQFEEA